MEPTFFATPAEWRAWLEAHHEDSRELLVGFYKKGTSLPSITWPQSVDQALCFGWIDGVRKRVDDVSYTIRFTPRKLKSIWSAVNIKRMRELIDDGLVHPAGLRAFEARTEDNSAIYSYEQGQELEFPPELAERFQAEPDAWKFFQSLPRGYRKSCVHHVVSAKREETRLRRLTKLIEHSARGERLPELTSPGRR